MGELKKKKKGQRIPESSKWDDDKIVTKKSDVEFIRNGLFSLIITNVGNRG